MLSFLGFKDTHSLLIFHPLLWPLLLNPSCWLLFIVLLSAYCGVPELNPWPLYNVTHSDGLKNQWNAGHTLIFISSLESLLKCRCEYYMDYLTFPFFFSWSFLFNTVMCLIIDFFLLFSLSLVEFCGYFFHQSWKVCHYFWKKKFYSFLCLFSFWSVIIHILLYLMWSLTSFFFF